MEVQGDTTYFCWTQYLFEGNSILPEPHVQEPGGTCSSSALVTHILATYRLMQARAGVPSNEWLDTLSADNVISATSEAGSKKLRDVVNYLIQNEIPIQTRWLPLAIDGLEKSTRVTIGRLFDDLTDMSPGKKVENTGEYWTTEMVCRKIHDDGPIIGVFAICEDYFQSEEGVYMAKGRLRRGRSGAFRFHAVVIVGWGRREGVYYFKYLNSRGSDFGHHGYGKVAMTAVLEYHSLHRR